MSGVFLPRRSVSTSALAVGRRGLPPLIFYRAASPSASFGHLLTNPSSLCLAPIPERLMAPLPSVPTIKTMTMVILCESLHAIALGYTADGGTRLALLSYFHRNRQGGPYYEPFAMQDAIPLISLRQYNFPYLYDYRPSHCSVPMYENY